MHLVYDGDENPPVDPPVCGDCGEPTTDLVLQEAQELLKMAMHNEIAGMLVLVLGRDGKQVSKYVGGGVSTAYWVGFIEYVKTILIDKTRQIIEK